MSMITCGVSGKPCPTEEAFPPCDGSGEQLLSLQPRDGSNYIALSSPSSSLPEGNLPPSLDDLNSMLTEDSPTPGKTWVEHIGFQGICRSDNEPYRFFGSRLMTMMGMTLSNESEKAEAASREVRDSMPDAIRSCSPSDAYFAEYTALAGAINRESKQLLDASRDPLITLVAAPKLAEALMRRSGLALTEPQGAFLTEIAVVGLSQGLAAEEIEATAGDVIDTGDSDDFLFRLFALVSLKVAQELIAGDERASSLLPGFGVFADEIGAAVADGRIAVRTMTVAEKMRSATSFAFYNSVANMISFAPMDGGVALDGMIPSMIHELVHAHQDLARRTMTKFKVEEEAYLRTSILEILLGRNLLFTPSRGLDLMTKIFRSMGKEEDERQQACLGFPADVLRRQEEREEKYAAAVKDWNVAVAQALEGGDTGDLPTAFRNFYRTIVVRHAYDRVSAREMADAGSRVRWDVAADVRAMMERAFDRVESSIEAMHRAPQGSLQRAQEARNAIDANAQALSFSFHLDRDLWIASLELLIDEGYDLGEALLDEPRTHDGI